MGEMMPEIRFKGFDNEWQEYTLGNIATVKGRLGWKSLKQDEYTQEGPSMVAGRHIKNGEILWNKVDHIPQWRYEESPEIKLKDNDIIFSKDGSLGNPALIENLDREVTINSTMMLVRINKFIVPRFFYHTLFGEKFRDMISIKVSGSSIPHLFQDDMKKFVFNAPSIREQVKIGRYLSMVDNIINHRQNELDKISNFKQAMLQKMFPKEGETVPEIRFKGFEDNWNINNFKNIGSISMCKRIYKNQTSVKGEIPFYKIGTFGGKADTFISKETFVEYKNLYSYPKKGDILISASGTIGRTIVFDNQDAYFQDSNIIWLNHDESKILNAFLKHYYTIVKWDGIEGSTIKRLYNSNFLNTKVIYPTIEEQRKVSGFLDTLDASIISNHKEINKLKQFKQAMLDKLFV